MSNVQDPKFGGEVDIGLWTLDFGLLTNEPRNE